MKNCPFCKAEIQDNARFCLYCMTPLNQKEVIIPQKKRLLRWPFAVVGVLLVVLVILLWGIQDKKPDASLENTDPPSTVTQSTTLPSSNTEETPSTGAPVENPSPEPTDGPTDETTEIPEPEPKPEPEPEPEPESEPEPEPEPKPVIPENLPDNQWADQETGAIYQFRPAVQTDVLGASYQVTDDDIVLEKLVQTSITKEYRIPSHINGKKVISIGEKAFLGVTAITIVYLPETVISLGDWAFWKSHLRHLFFPGAFLATGNCSYDAFLVTVYCAEFCHNQKGTLYSDERPDDGSLGYRTWWAWWGEATTEPVTPVTVATPLEGYGTWEDPQTGAVYKYRDATDGGYTYGNYLRYTDDIMITDLVTESADGIYDIPSHIDGRRVVSISNRAFKDSNAKIVYLPEGLHFLGTEAFWNTPLTDLYIRGELLGTHSHATPSKVVYHCSVTCGFLQTKYAETRTYWEEWDG